ncbi:MAG: HPr family phosphocarrier protein [Candidatus Hydrogenedentota bacterium]
MKEITEELVIVNNLGMHARPAATLVQTVLEFESDITIQKNGREVNAKSIMGLLTLAAAQGSRVTVTCKGSDAEEAMGAVRKLFETGFGEQ